MLPELARDNVQRVQNCYLFTSCKGEFLSGFDMVLVSIFPFFFVDGTRVQGKSQCTLSTLSKHYWVIEDLDALEHIQEVFKLIYEEITLSHGHGIDVLEHV